MQSVSLGVCKVQFQMDMFHASVIYNTWGSSLDWQGDWCIQGVPWRFPWGYCKLVGWGERWMKCTSKIPKEPHNTSHYRNSLLTHWQPLVTGTSGPHPFSANANFHARASFLDCPWFGSWTSHTGCEPEPHRGNAYFGWTCTWTRGSETLMGKIIGFYCHIKPKSGPEPPVHWVRTQTGPEPQGSGSAGAWTKPRGAGSSSGTKCPNLHRTGPQTV